MRTIEKIKDIELKDDVTSYHSLVKITSTLFLVAYAAERGVGSNLRVDCFSYDPETYEMEKVGSTGVSSNDNYTYISLIYLGIYNEEYYSMVAYSIGDVLEVRLLRTNNVGVTDLRGSELEVSKSGDSASLATYTLNHAILAYHDITGASGRIVSILVNSTFTALSTEGDMEHSNIGGSQNSLVAMGSNWFLLAYYKESGKGKVKTFTAQDTSPYTITGMGSSDFTTQSSVYYNSLIKITSSQFALCYNDHHTTGNLYGMEIGFSGGILTPGLRLSIATNAYMGSIALIDSTIAVAYTGDGLDGYITIFNSSLEQLDNLEFDTITSVYPSLIGWDSNKFLLAHKGGTYEGMLTLFGEKSFKIQIGGEWERVHGGKINIDGTWRDIKALQILRNGTWEDVNYTDD